MNKIQILGPSKSFKKQTYNILPCPLCDEKAKLMPMYRSPWWRVRCDNYHCGCTTWACPTQEKAIAAWHRRGHGTIV